MQNPEEEDYVQSQEDAEEVSAQHEEEENHPQEFHLEPAADPALELELNFAEQSEVSTYNKYHLKNKNNEPDIAIQLSGGQTEP